MGLSSSKTTNTQTNTPSVQQVNAGNTLQSAFNTQLPKINAYADQIGGLVPTLLGRAQNGDPGINDAQNWAHRTLQGDGSNPHLQAMIDQSGQDTYNTLAAQAGTRGITGGSAFNRMIGHEIDRNSVGLRDNDWQQGQQRQAQAAGMAPGLAAGSLAPIASLLETAQFAGGSPLNATSQYASGMGSLFGNTGTQTNTQKSSPGLLGLLGSGLAGWASGGFGR